MNCTVVSVCNRIPDRNREPYYRFGTFVASLERFGVSPVILGLNQEWRGLMTKPRRLREWLRSGACTTDLLFVTDAFDVVFAAPPDEVVAEIVRHWSHDEVVFNAERGLFPRGEL